MKPIFDVTGDETDAMRLRHAVLLYEGSCKSLATIHDVAKVGDAVTILAGKPMTAASALRLARALAQGRQQQGFIPAMLLYAGADVMLWWRPPSSRHIGFRCPELGAPERAAVVPHPGLVFAAGVGVWRVWAVKGEERPTPESSLFRAPYFNVWTDANICHGNVTVPPGSSASQIAAWEDAFFSSWFTHPNTGRESLVRWRGGAHCFWKSMLAGGHAVFPEHVLITHDMQLGDVLRQFD